MHAPAYFEGIAVKLPQPIRVSHRGLSRAYYRYRLEIFRSHYCTKASRSRGLVGAEDYSGSYSFFASHAGSDKTHLFTMGLLEQLFDAIGALSPQRCGIANFGYTIVNPQVSRLWCTPFNDNTIEACPL